MCEVLVVSDNEWRRLLYEGQKSISTHRNPDALAQAMGGSKKLSSKGSSLTYTKKLEAIKDKYRGLLDRELQSDKSEKEIMDSLRENMREIFSLAYALGLRTQTGSKKTTSNIVKDFTNADRRHVLTAVSEELRFVRRFVQNIKNEALVMPYETRLDLYVQGLDGIFGGARVAALPDDALIWWSGPVDKKKCASCDYLLRASPFHKTTLPTTPKAGDTLCLGNCRDQLVARSSSPEEIRAVLTGKTRDEHVAALENIRKERDRKRRARRLNK